MTLTLCVAPLTTSDVARPIRLVSDTSPAHQARRKSLGLGKYIRYKSDKFPEENWGYAVSKTAHCPIYRSMGMRYPIYISSYKIFIYDIAHTYHLNIWTKHNLILTYYMDLYNSHISFKHMGDAQI